MQCFAAVEFKVIYKKKQVTAEAHLVSLLKGKKFTLKYNSKIYIRIMPLNFHTFPGS